MMARQPCTGGTPPWCCQPPMTREEWDRRGWRLKVAANLPTRCGSCGEVPLICPRCGSRSLMTLFVTDRRSWLCLDCRREISPGGEG